MTMFIISDENLLILQPLTLTKLWRKEIKERKRLKINKALVWPIMDIEVKLNPT